MKQFFMKEYYKQPAEEARLVKDYKLETKSDIKREKRKKLLDFRGIKKEEVIVKGKKIITYALDDIRFVEYIFMCFQVVFICGSVMFYNWKKHLYEFLDDAYYLGMFKKLIDGKVKTLWCSKLENTYKKRFIRDIPIKLTEWSVPTDYIIFNNGCFKVSTGEFEAGDHPEIINRCCTGYDYDENATCDHFEAFMDDVFNGDKELISVAQEMGGYTLMMGSNPSQNITLLMGQGRNGKGVFCNVMTKMLGTDNVSGVSVQRLSGTFGPGDLDAKILNISSENEESVSVNTSVIKAISGADKIAVEKKFKQAIYQRLSCKLWICTNDITFSDTSKGFEERIVPIIFKNVYVSNPKPGTNQRKRNNNLEEELCKELPGIFNYCYKGLVRLRENGWKITDSVEVQKQKRLLVESSNPVLLFTRTMVIQKPNTKIAKSQVYKRFKEWSAENNINIGIVASAQKFYPKFELALSGKGMISSTKRIHGINYYQDFEINPRNQI